LQSCARRKRDDISWISGSQDPSQIGPARQFSLLHSSQSSSCAVKSRTRRRNSSRHASKLRRLLAESSGSLSFNIRCASESNRSALNRSSSNSWRARHCGLGIWVPLSNERAPGMAALRPTLLAEAFQKFDEPRRREVRGVKGAHGQGSLRGFVTDKKPMFKRVRVHSAGGELKVWKRR